MIYSITPYKQHRYNCAIACLLMILEYKKIIPKATYFYEKEYEKNPCFMPYISDVNG